MRHPLYHPIQNKNSKPYLIIQFENDLFFNDREVTTLFKSPLKFEEASLGAHTFLIELELIDVYDPEDIALYRMVNTAEEVIQKIPKAILDFDIYGTHRTLYCLQASPSGTNLGRLVNESCIDGLMDHHGIARDPIGGNFVRKGLRYLLKGYFRFGSSGAPYFIFDEDEQIFKVNALQSEASPIQLSIKNDRTGNFQYVNAIASPICLAEKRIKELLA